MTPRFAHAPTRTCWTLCPVPTWGRVTDRICYDDCASTNQYKDTADRICKDCHSTCLTCSGPLDTDCLSCSGSRYLYGSKCLTDCGEGKYGDSTTSTCKNCNSNCKTCKTPNEPNTCLTCRSNMYLKSNLCTTPCTSSEYEDDQDNQCKACEGTCATCFGGLSTNCLSCSGGLHYYEVDHTCISACPSPYFAESSTNKCYKTCPVISTTTYFGRNSSRTCNPTCLTTNEWPDPSDRICRTCHSECLTCDGLSNSNCLTCAAGRFLKNKMCITTCGSRFYGDTSDNTCKPCTAPCHECLSPNGPTTCSTCQPITSTNYFLEGALCLAQCTDPNWGRLESYTCETTCINTKQYGDPADRVCKDCDSTCLTCDHLGCLTCEGDRFLYEKTCTKNCPTDLGYWANVLTNICDRCHSTCLTCDGSEIDDCLSCQLPNFLFNSKCITPCPITPKILYGNPVNKVCVESGPEGYYADKESQTCMRCHNSCKNCTLGGLSTECTGCAMNVFFTPERGTCTEVCSDGFFSLKLASGLKSSNCTRKFKKKIIYLFL